MERGSKFRIFEVEGLYYLYGKNKDADQLRSYPAERSRSAPLFSHMQKAGFLMTRLR